MKKILETSYGKMLNPYIKIDILSLSSKYDYQLINQMISYKFSVWINESLFNV